MKKAAALLSLLVMLTALPASAASFTRGDDGNCGIRKQGGVWADVQGASSGDSLRSGCGGWSGLDSGTFYIDRNFLQFDLTGFSDTITEAYYVVNETDAHDADGIEKVMVESTPGTPGTLSTADFPNVDTTELTDRVAWPNGGGDKILTFNSAGLSYLNSKLNDWATLSLRQSTDIDNVEPTGNNSSEAAGTLYLNEPPPGLAVCGDSAIESPEQCDDGNTDDADGCSSICEIEPGYVCSGEPSVCSFGSICGDGSIDGSEQCDDANTDAGDGCSDTCQREAGYACVDEPSMCTYDMVAAQLQAQNETRERLAAWAAISFCGLIFLACAFYEHRS